MSDGTPMFPDGPWHFDGRGSYWSAWMPIPPAALALRGRYLCGSHPSGPLSVGVETTWDKELIEVSGRRLALSPGSLCHADLGPLDGRWFRLRLTVAGVGDGRVRLRLTARAAA
jgi:hypothetical protein